MIRIDLHVHSTFSDGTFCVKSLVSAAKARGIVVLALTDHDTVDGLPIFESECKKAGVRGIPGIELSAEAPYTLHILGYRLIDRGPLAAALAEIVAHRNERNALICRKLTALGMEVSLGEIEREAAGEIVARPHIARVLVRKGYVDNVASAFDQYLERGKPGYVSRKRLSPRECISLIGQCGGLAVLAHPQTTKLAEDDFDLLLDELKGYGLWGMECLYSRNPPALTLDLLRTADRHSLYATAGSDFHGANKPDIRLGFQVREDFLPWARLGVRF